MNLKDSESYGESNDSLQSSLSFGADATGRALLSYLKPDAPIVLDQLVEALPGTSPSEIIAALFELELAGLVRQLPGKSFIKVWAD